MSPRGGAERRRRKGTFSTWGLWGGVDDDDSSLPLSSTSQTEETYLQILPLLLNWHFLPLEKRIVMLYSVGQKGLSWVARKLKHLACYIIDNVYCQCAVCFLHPDVLEMPPGKRMTAALSNLAINLSSSLLLDIYALQKKLDLWLHGPHAHLQGWTQFQQAHVCEYAITNSEFRFLDYWCTEFKQICQSKCLLKPFHLQERCIEGWNLNSLGIL